MLGLIAFDNEFSELCFFIDTMRKMNRIINVWVVTGSVFITKASFGGDFIHIRVPCSHFL
jgi:hypothetical protein